MARGGRRRGTPGKSYANRSDLNVVRADQPGSSQPAPPPTMSEADLPQMLPSDVPNLTDPSSVEQSLPQSLMNAPQNSSPLTQSQTLLYAALKADPHNPALQRIRARMQVYGGMR